MKRNGTAKGGLNDRPDERKTETIDGATGKPVDPPVKTPRRIDLSSLRDVRIELAALYRKMDSGEIESTDGSKRAYVLKTIADVITVGEIERRIDELEGRIAPGGQPQLPARTLN